MRPERAALIAAIRAAPDDDAPRLICADWFEEQGDEASAARAEFIRTQIRRANLAADDVCHSELEARELRLLKRWAPAWCGSHFAFKKVRFRRGFIEYVHLHLRHFLHHRRQLLALEPVRDVSLTGWFRAPTELIRRVAGCEEWQDVERLRVHHQGPHKDPRSNLVDLLESPHLTRLRALQCPGVQFDAGARRRFEQLPVLRRLRELDLPTLDTYPHNPGEWFADGGAAFAGEWGELRSLTLPHFLRLDLLRRLSEMPFWDRLTAVGLVLPYQTGEALAVLRDRLPASLRELRLGAGHRPADFSGADSFFTRLAQAPLRGLHLAGIPLRAAALGRLLGGADAWDLRELSLEDCQVAADHAGAIAASPAVRNLHSLSLSSNEHFAGDAARTLFASEHLRRVVRLDLAWTRMGTKGATALASAKGWDRLRSLDLSNTGLDTNGLRALLASPNARHLTSLALAGGGYRGEPALAISPAVAAEMARLPHLVRLHLNARDCDPRSKKNLSESDSLAWSWVEDEDDPDIQNWRAARAPGRWHPVDGGEYGGAPV
jgi:uncharacterized protein (TIGR02996 family)